MQCSSNLPTKRKETPSFLFFYIRMVFKRESLDKHLFGWLMEGKFEYIIKIPLHEKKRVFGAGSNV